MHPRALSNLLTFQELVIQDDEYGGSQQSWVDRFQIWGHIRYLRGGEQIMQARLEKRQPVILTFHENENTLLIEASWRVIYGSQIFELKEAPRPNEERRAYLEVLAEA